MWKNSGSKGADNRFILCGAAGDALLHRPALVKKRGAERRARCRRCLHGTARGAGASAREKRQECRTRSDRWPRAEDRGVCQYGSPAGGFSREGYGTAGRGMAVGKHAAVRVAAAGLDERGRHQRKSCRRTRAMDGGRIKTDTRWKQGSREECSAMQRFRPRGQAPGPAWALRRRRWCH